MLGHRTLTLDDFLSIVRRRVWLILLPSLVVPIIAFLVSLELPARYTSETLVLVEQQRVPDNFVKPVISQELIGRLATLQQQILSRSRLEPVIEKFGLYKEDRSTASMEDLIDRMRKDLVVTPLRPSETANPNERVPGFTIMFTASNPKVAQEVCSLVTSMFIEENLKVREQRAESTTDFLSKQLDEAKHKLDDQDAALAKFQSAQAGRLPGQEQTNLSMLGGFTTQLEGVNQALSRAQQEKTFVESLLAQQLGAWQNSSNETTDLQKLQDQLNAARAVLNDVEARYTPTHPDVLKAKDEVANMKRKYDEALAASEKPNTEPRKSSALEPPEIKKLRAQAKEYEISINQLTQEQKRLREMVQRFQSQLQLTPVVEEQFKNLTRDYQTALQFYNDLLAKKSQASMATDLERRQQGEQFQVMDAANLPEKPTWPNRPLIALAGLAGGIALGLLLALLLEAKDQSLRTESDILTLLKIPILARVPIAGKSISASFWNRTPRPRLTKMERQEKHV
ncbi:MAG: GNVR domain-containing protein [Candidatus Korobacteraceae bacterium]|jgi:polysaccharide chain length determinant protein (PEP-CTERM system associated)